MNNLEQKKECKTIKQIADELQINPSVIRKRIDDIGIKAELQKEKNSYIINSDQEQKIKESFGFYQTSNNDNVDFIQENHIKMEEESIPFEDNDFLDLGKNESKEIVDTEKKSIFKKNWFKFKKSENYQVEILGTLLVIVALIVVCVITLSQIVNHSHIEEMEKMKSVSQQIKNLEAKIDSLEESLRLTEKDKLDINVNVNGDETSLTYDVSTGKVEPQEEDGQILDENFDTRPFLGVAFDTADDSNPLGLEVSYVYQYSPAEFAGVKVGDIITKANDVVVTKYEDLTTVIDDLRSGDKLTIQVITIENESITTKTLETTLTYRGNFNLENTTEE